jgi:hypothetical protein
MGMKILKNVYVVLPLNTRSAISATIMLMNTIQKLLLLIYKMHKRLAVHVDYLFSLLLTQLVQPFAYTTGSTFCLHNLFNLFAYLLFVGCYSRE